MLEVDVVYQLQNQLDQLIPPGAAGIVSKIKAVEESTEYPEEMQHVAKAVQKRQNEFIAGRRCARRALAKIGTPPCPLPADKHRAPQWPKGIVGSISHTTDLCCAVTAQQSEVKCLGVDLEKTTRISSGVIQRILHPAEADIVGTDQTLGSLYFSAKEAFFKAQFPIWGVWPNFEDLALKADASVGSLEVDHIAAHLPKDLCSMAVKLQFRYSFIADSVLVICWLKQ